MTDLRKLLPKTFYAFFGQFPQLRPAQEQTIPHVLSGNNVLLISPTGSGKTEAVVAPVAEQALDSSSGIYCLYICPTKALVNDIERRIENPLRKAGIIVGVRHGDRKTKQGKTIPNILITTPESLDVMLSSPKAEDKDRLRTIRVVIVDEVHQFYQTHRGYQLVLLLERLKRTTKASLQRLLLSATVAEPEKMAAWFQGGEKSFTVVQIQGSRKLNVSLDRLLANNGEEFKQGHAVVKTVLPIVNKHKKILLFANSRNECDWLFWILHDRIGVETFLHYSTLDKKYRERVERQFRQADRALCIATSTLELGIDIGDIDAVAMYGAPASISSFIQRIGRGNRRKSSSQVVYGLCRDYHVNGRELGAEHDLIMFYALVDSMLDSELEIKADTRLFSVYVQQFLSLASHYGGSVVRDVLWEIIQAAEPQSTVMRADLDLILSALSSGKFFNFDPARDAYFCADGWETVRNRLLLWSNIASNPHDTVINEDVPVSEIPHGKAVTGGVFLFAGRPRIVTEITGSLVKTSVLDIDDPQMIVYETPGAATPLEVARKAQELLRSVNFPDLPIEADDSLVDLMKLHRGQFRNWDFDCNVPYKQIGKQFCYYTFGGTWANEMLAMLLRDQNLSVPTVDSWRIYTNRLIESFAGLPVEVSELERTVRDNFSVFTHRIGFSYHFFQLPYKLQISEVCSLLDLARLAGWLANLKRRKLLVVA